MKYNKLILFLTILLFVSCSVNKQYEISNISVSRQKIDASLDKETNPEMIEIIDSYKMALDNEMNIEIGTAAQYMEKGAPQSLLSNFTADVMKQRSEELWGHTDFAVVNMGGLRAALNEGTITIRNIYEIYSFDNYLVLIDLTGKEIKEFFEVIAKTPEGLSKGVNVKIKKRQIESLLIGGKPLDENKVYKVATLDYLANGNDKMTVFEKAINRVESDETLRDVILNYVKRSTIDKKLIDAKLDDRIIITD